MTSSPLHTLFLLKLPNRRKKLLFCHRRQDRRILKRYRAIIIDREQPLPVPRFTSFPGFRIVAHTFIGFNREPGRHFKFRQDRWRAFTDNMICYQLLVRELLPLIEVGASCFLYGGDYHVRP